jgi:haloacetate dehalogenase
MCEDYRAAAGIDLVHDRASRAVDENVQHPALVLWGSKGRIGAWCNAPENWGQYCAADVTGAAINPGHYLAEAAPEATLQWCTQFFA